MPATFLPSESVFFYPLFDKIKAMNDKRKRVKNIVDATSASAQKRAIPKTPLTVGQEIFVFNANNTDSRASSTLLGYKYGEFLCFEKPASKNGPLHINVGEKFIIKFISKGEVIGFRSRLISTVGAMNKDNPIELYLAEFPEDVETLKIRSVERMDVFIPAVCVLAGKKVKAVLLDLSRRGGRFLFKPPHPIKKGTKFTASIMMPTGYHVIDLPMEIRRIFELTGGKVEVGVEFDYSRAENGDELEERIVQYLALSELE